MEADNINNIYRKRDAVRWQSQGFTVGVEIHRSKSADVKCEVCKHMNGIYPKSFIFQGWHEKCICFITPVMLEGEEFTKYLLTGEVPQNRIIRHPPDKVIAYIKANYENLKQYYWVEELLKY